MALDVRKAGSEQIEYEGRNELECKNVKKLRGQKVIKATDKCFSKSNKGKIWKKFGHSFEGGVVSMQVP